jgi:hypothetical protein
MIKSFKKCDVLFSFLVSFYFSVLLIIKNAFKRVFVFLKNDQNNISYPKLRNYKISKFKILNNIEH